MTDLSGEFETKQEAVEETGSKAKAWLQAIEKQKKSKAFKHWVKRAKEIQELELNEGDEKQEFNILYSNTETMRPAIYNSQPSPDIRERYNEGGAGQYAAMVLERAVNYQIDQEEFHDTMKDVVLDGVLIGRGIPRLRYEPIITKEQVPVVNPDGTQQVIEQEKIAHQSVKFELVDFDMVIIGPAKRWRDVSFVAFEHMMTREQLNALNPEIGPSIALNQTVNCDDDEKEQPPEMLKRAVVYEIWDKELNEVCFVAKDWPDDVLMCGPPAFNVSGFYPIPRPFYAIRKTGSLIPAIPYQMYASQAVELDRLTKRIKGLQRCLKWRGVYLKGFDVMADIEKLDDGEFKPIGDEITAMAGVSIDKAVMFMPIAELVGVIRELYTQREQIKQTIYEITGISDILRGSSKAQETLGAQQLKAQWGSLRISDMQEEVQRVARDLIRMTAEIISENFEKPIIEACTNMQVNDEVLGILRNDMLRRYKIDIETDSTIKADLSRSQQNISQFIGGFGQFIQSVGPAVQSGQMPKDVAVDLLISFSKQFRLGRQADEALDRMKAAQQQPQQQPEQGTGKEELMLEKYKIDTESKTKLQIAQMTNQKDYAVAQMNKTQAVL